MHSVLLLTFKVYFMKIRLLIFLLLLSQLINAQNSNQDYFRSPLNIPIVLAGNFGELRPSHFHSGIDIKTAGHTGLPVFAAAQGDISRIHVSPFGFGLALYIDHPNGMTTVYGHLSKFRKDIQEYVRKNQYKRESFTVDLTVPKGTFMVEKGEQIAWSGNSGGSGGPHLHFEIRDTKSEHPLNPLRFKFKIPDDIKPKILSVMVYPLSDDANVYGKPTKHLIEAVFYDGAYHLKGNPTIPVYGDVGFGIQTVDYLNGSWSKCGVYEIKLAVDEKPIYTFLMNELSFNETRYVNSHMDYSYYRDHYKKIQKSWVEPGNKLNNYPELVNRGIVNLSDGKGHEINYEVDDAYGNKSTLAFNVVSKKVDVPRQEGTGRWIQYDQESDFITQGLEAYFKPGTFYSSFHLDFKVLPENNFYYSPLYHLQDDDTPVQQAYLLKIKANKVPMELWNKALIATVNEKNGRKWAIGGRYVNGWVTAQVRQMGTFTITFDTIPPTIQPLSISRHSRLTNPNSIRFRIKDDFSGIDSYRGEIDGHWVLFEYDAKNNQINYNFDKKRLQLGKNHELALTVTDNKGNKSEYKASFYR